MSEHADPPAGEPTQRTIGFGDLLRGVNLRDFFDMVKGEFALVLTSARLAVHAKPILMPLAVVLVVLRLFLLVGVIVVLGGAITMIMMLRGLTRFHRKDEEPS
ncbi:MAG: hypothetical protein WEB04_07510 [Dehalococcoidia bacterium]